MGSRGTATPVDAVESNSQMDGDLARRMLEAAPDALIALDHDGRIEQVNRQVETLFGYPRSELVGNKIDMLLPERFRQGHPGRIEEVVADPRGRLMGFGLAPAARRKDGTEFPFEISLSPVDVDGTAPVVAAIRDITERRRGEDELHKIGERFQQLVESSLDGLIILDPQGRIQHVNAEVEIQFGYGRAELIGSMIEALLPKQLADVHVAHRDGYFAHPTARRMAAGQDVKARRKDGSEFPVDVSLGPLETSEGHFAVARIRDITESVRLQKELREKAALVDLAHDAIVVLDPADGRIRYWNRGAEALYGYTAEEATGRLSGDLLKRVSISTFSEILALAAKSDHWDGTVKHTTKRGDELVVESRLALLRDASGEATGVLEINRDVTEVARASKALQDANQSLEVHVQERTADLEAFSYSVSHDLRTPLRALTGFVTVLVEEAPGQLNADALDALDEIRSNAARMGQLIDDLLAFARLGRRELEKRDVDMTAIAQHASDELVTFRKGRPIELAVEAMPPCNGDPALLEQVWTNLLSNAIKFTAGREPARITAGAETQGKTVVYFVRDNGVGFDMAHTGKLFGVFQRLHAADEFEGNGVGLANVMRICGRHGGTAWAQAAVGKGATFYFTVGAGRP